MSRCANRRYSQRKGDCNVLFAGHTAANNTSLTLRSDGTGTLRSLGLSFGLTWEAQSATTAKLHLDDGNADVTYDKSTGELFMRDATGRMTFRKD